MTDMIPMERMAGCLAKASEATTMISTRAEKNMAVLDERNVKIIRIEKVELDPKAHQLIEGSQQLVKVF